MERMEEGRLRLPPQVQQVHHEPYVIISNHEEESCLEIIKFIDEVYVYSRH